MRAPGLHVGVFDIHQDTLRAEINIVRAQAVELVGLEQVSLVGHVHPVFGDLHVLAKLVGAVVTVIEENIDEMGGRRKLQTAQAADRIGRRIAYPTGVVHIVGQQHPRLVLGFAQQGLFLAELQPVRFLRHAPRTVPAPFDSDISLVDTARAQPVVIHDLKRSGHIFLLRDDRYAAGIDIDHGQPREADQADPVLPLLAAFVPDRQHDRARKIHLGFSAGDLLRPHINPLAFEFELGDEHLVLHHE